MVSTGAIGVMVVLLLGHTGVHRAGVVSTGAVGVMVVLLPKPVKLRQRKRQRRRTSSGNTFHPVGSWCEPPGTWGGRACIWLPKWEQITVGPQC